MSVLRLELRGSRALAGVLAAVHAAGAACLLAAAPGPAGWALAGLLAALGAASAWDRGLLRSRGSVRALELGPDGQATLELADGRRLARRVGRRRHVGAVWVALTLAGAPRRGLLVTGDMLEPEEFRRLRLWALWGRVPGPNYLK